MIVVGVTGASGPVIGIRLIEELLNGGEEVMGIVSEQAWGIISHEIPHAKAGDLPLNELLQHRGVARDLHLLSEFGDDDFSSPAASGSSKFDAVVVAPCSMKTLSAIANGYSSNLIVRACDVAFKERRRIIIVPRETPLSIIHIENMRKAAMAGAVILPPVPGFYPLPKTIEDVVDFVVGKILNLLDKEHTLFRGWGDDT